MYKSLGMDFWGSLHRLYTFVRVVIGMPSIISYFGRFQWQWRDRILQRDRCVLLFRKNWLDYKKNHTTASVRFRKESRGGRPVKLKTFSACQKTEMFLFHGSRTENKILLKKKKNRIVWKRFIYVLCSLS